MWNVLIRSVCVAGLVATLAACGGNDTAEAPATAVTVVIGPQGGTVSGPDGVQAIIPPGALSQPTTIGIARSSTGAPAMPADNPPVGSAYEFTPHDLVFNAPVTLRMPVPAGAVGSELFMASPGGDWQVVEATVVDGVAQWQRNSFSWSLMGAVCSIPAGNTDPYPCVMPMGAATANAAPASAITRIQYEYFALGSGSGNAGSWQVTQPGAVSVTMNYRAAPDCGVNGTALSGQVKLIRWNPAATPRVVQTVFDGIVSLTDTPVTPPIGTFSTGGGAPNSRGVGSTTVDVSAYLTDPVNAFGFSFACARPGKPLMRGGDLLTFVGALPPAPGPFTIGGSISGLSGTGLVLQNNGGDDLAVADNATSFTFASSIARAAPYGVSVLTQPAGQTCTVQQGSGTASNNVVGVAVACAGLGPTPLRASAVVAGVNNALAVALDGTVWAWGYQVDPITGGHKASAPWATEPVQVQGLSGVRAVALSGESGAFYALHTDGTVSAWGYNTAGQLGDRTTTDRLLPVKVMQDASTPMDEVCSIAAAANILLMARETGCSPGQRPVASGPWIAGLFNSTTIGGDTSSVSRLDGAIAKAVPGWPAGQTVSQLRTPDSASTNAAAFFRTGRGDLYVWGYNGGNLLGAGVSTTFAGSAAGPVPPNGLFWSGISPPQLGRDFSIAIDETGSLVAVGRNLEGQLGIGSTNSSTSLMTIPAPIGVSDFSVGQNSAAAIVNGQIWAWGWDANRIFAVTVPTRVGNGSGFTQISVGDSHSLAIGPNAEVYSWGSSFAGGLGRGGSAGTPAVVMRP
jgi:alpha-tubulin suppressor-like RCC1 family protein